MVTLQRHRDVWQRKRVLREIYQNEFFDRLTRWRVPGPTLEIGGGPGYYKEEQPDIVSSDILPTRWLDLVADCQQIPFADASFANIVGLDVFHHIGDPLNFLCETQRVLRPGGRLVLVEPWITPFSYLVYRYMHQEDCFLSWQPGDTLGNDKDPFEANGAQPFLVFQRHWQRVEPSVPSLRVRQIERFSLFAYLLSFGFKPLNLLPAPFYPVVSSMERLSQPLWEPLAALRALIVVEKD